MAGNRQSGPVQGTTTNSWKISNADFRRFTGLGDKGAAATPRPLYRTTLTGIEHSDGLGSGQVVFPPLEEPETP